MELHAMSNQQQLKAQVTGVLTHCNDVFVYLQYGQFSSDSNLTITVRSSLIVVVMLSV